MCLWKYEFCAGSSNRNAIQLTAFEVKLMKIHSTSLRLWKPVINFCKIILKTGLYSIFNFHLVKNIQYTVPREMKKLLTPYINPYKIGNIFFAQDWHWDYEVFPIKTKCLLETIFSSLIFELGRQKNPRISVDRIDFCLMRRNEV